MPEVWGAKLNRAFQRKLVAAQFFDNYSSEIAGRGDLLHIPAISNGFTATHVHTTSGDIATTDLSDTNTSLTLNQWMATSFIMTDLDKRLIGSQYRLQDEYIAKMAYALAAKVDTDLLALASGITKGLGDSATNITSTVLLQAMAFMESSSIPLSECAWVFHPNAYIKVRRLFEKIVSKFVKLLETLRLETISSQVLVLN